jgi:hypothetical protein
VLRTWGDGPACTDYAGWCLNGAVDEAAEAVAGFLTSPAARREWGRLDWLEIEGLAEDDSMARRLSANWQTKGRSVHSRSISNTWVVALPRQWDEFERGLKKSFRRKCKKAVQRLQSGSAGASTMGDPDALDAVWSDFKRLHQARRNAVGQAGCFADPRFESFLKRAVARLMAEKRAWLHGVTWDGRPAAFCLVFRSGPTAMLYQAGIDPDQLAVEPGHMIVAYALREAIAAGLTSFDFLRGDEIYKARWGARPRPLVTRRWVMPPWPSRVRHAAWLAGRTLLHWARGPWRGNSHGAASLDEPESPDRPGHLPAENVS